jgi:hypothetical protein
MRVVALFDLKQPRTIVKQCKRKRAPVPPI